MPCPPRNATFRPTPSGSAPRGVLGVLESIRGQVQLTDHHRRLIEAASRRANWAPLECTADHDPIFDVDEDGPSVDESCPHHCYHDHLVRGRGCRWACAVDGEPQSFDTSYPVNPLAESAEWICEACARHLEAHDPTEFKLRDNVSPIVFTDDEHCGCGVAIGDRNFGGKCSECAREVAA